MSEIKKNIEVIRCEACNQEFQNQEDLNMHNSSKHNISLKKEKYEIKDKYKILAGIIIILAIAGIFVPKSFTGNVIKEQEIKEFTIKAFSFYYDPNKIEVNQGDKIRIIIDNADVLHGIRIPDLGIKGNEIIEFVADKQGEFTWYCANMCGVGHLQMQGKLIVK